MVVLGVIGAALFALAFGWLVMILWNWLMPAIFHLGAIAYWQAFGIVILAKLIFGGMGGGGTAGRGANPWSGNPWRADRTRAVTTATTGATIAEFWEEEGQQAFDEYLDRKRPRSRTAEGPVGVTARATAQRVNERVVRDDEGERGHGRPKASPTDEHGRGAHAPLPFFEAVGLVWP